MTVKWIEVPAAAMRGEGLEPYPAGETSNLFDWVENPDARSTHVMPYFGEFIIDTVEIDPQAVHQPSKPGDEIVLILNGILRLTTDDSDLVQEFKAGEMVMIPEGWAGVYRVLPDSDGSLFRELCIVPGNYFTAAPPPSGKAPWPIELPHESGKLELLRTSYSLVAEVGDQAKDWSQGTSADEIILVQSGSLTLTSADETASFGAGSIVVLPKRFVGKATGTAGYSALVARWLG